MRKICTILSLFFLSLFSINSFSQIITHPVTGTTSFTIDCGTSYPYYDSGNIPSNYGSNEDAILILNPSAAGQFVEINFTSFGMEANGSVCDFDYINIYDGSSTASTIIGTYCTANIPGIITSTTGSLTVELHSDANTEEFGWEATVSCSGVPSVAIAIVQTNTTKTISCGNTYYYYDSGGNANYGANENSTLVLNPSDASKYVQIDFTTGTFNVEGCSCDCDYMTIYDGSTTSASVIGTFCNINTPGVITSSTGSLTIMFNSDSGTELDGWEVPITCSTTPGVNQITQPSSGNNTATIVCGNTYDYYDSGGQLNNYSASESGILTIQPNTAGQYVEVSFNTFNVEANGTGCFDYINIFDGDNTTVLIGTYCNSSPPTTITSSTGALTFEFFSDTGTQLDGWEASVSCSNTPGSNPTILIHPTTTSSISVNCGTTYTYYDSGGQLNNYSGDEAGVQTFNPSTSGQFINISFNTFDIEDCGTECCDYISIYDGTTINSPLIGTYCTSNTPTSITSSTGSLTIGFSSDANTTKLGWDATISCSNTAGSNPIIQPTSGSETKTITCGDTYEYYDSGAEGRNYYEDKNSLLTICPDASGEYVSIEINNLELENGSDYLYVFDGNNPSASILALFTGVINSSTIVTASSDNTSGCLSFRFLSDVGTQELGWDATISCESSASTPISAPSNDCTGAISVCSDDNLTGGTSGPGDQELPDAWSSCLGLATHPGEYQSNWYVFSSTSNGTVGFLLTPDAPTDYDWAIWGPYSYLECPAFTNDAPIRCSAASLSNSGTGGETGLQAGAGDTNEPSAGDGYLEPLNVLSGEIYIMMLDNWDANNNPFELSWQLSGATLDCTPLPVTLTSFIAYHKNNQTYLEWNTVSEVNNNFFVIEKSLDAVNFREIGKIFGNGNSNKVNYYSFTDTELNLKTTYYRLIQVDFDGTTNYSKIISISNESSTNNFSLFSEEGEIKIFFDEIPKENYTVMVVDCSGRVIAKKAISSSTESRMFTITNTKLTNGVYNVIIYNNNHSDSKKILMLNK